MATPSQAAVLAVLLMVGVLAEGFGTEYLIGGGKAIRRNLGSIVRNVVLALVAVTAVSMALVLSPLIAIAAFILLSVVAKILRDRRPRVVSERDLERIAWFQTPRGQMTRRATIAYVGLVVVVGVAMGVLGLPN